MFYKTIAENNENSSVFTNKELLPVSTTDIKSWLGAEKLKKVAYFSEMLLYTVLEEFASGKRYGSDSGDQNRVNKQIANLFARFTPETLSKFTIWDLEVMISKNYREFGEITRNYLCKPAGTDYFLKTIHQIDANWADLAIVLHLLANEKPVNLINATAAEMTEKYSGENRERYARFDFSNLPPVKNTIPFSNNRIINIQGVDYQIMSTKNIENELLAESNKFSLKIFGENNIQDVVVLKELKSGALLTVPLNYLAKMGIKPNVLDIFRKVLTQTGLGLQALRRFPLNVIKGVMFFILRLGTVIPMVNLAGELHFLVYAPALRPIHNQAEGAGFSHYGDNAYRKVFRERKVIMDWANPPKVVLEGLEFSLIDHNRFIAANMERKWILIKIVAREWLGSI